MTRRTFRVNGDSWTVLKDILVGTPEEFNEDLSSRYDRRSGFEKFSGTLRGRNVEMPWEISFGQLPQEFVNEMKDSVIRYVIYSYETPIAWRRVAEWNEDGTPVYEWVMPMEKDAKGNERNIRYSNTTSKHQGKVATALSQITGGI